MFRLDLVDFFRGKYTWRKLMVLLERLPWDSKYKLAIDDDEETAAAFLEEELDTEGEGEQPRRGPIPLQQWSQWSELRAAMLDGLALVARTIVMVHTPKGRHVPPLRFQPRPETALERVRRQHRDAVMTELEAQFEGLNQQRWDQPAP